jgi:serine/threonine protein kinase/tetratricopeptide (TPR) repeat protein
MVGQTVSHYRVLKLLGRGGMGTVYQAEDTRLGRQVALKFLPADLARDRHALERFQREARAASALNHPHICTIHDINEAEPSTRSGAAAPFIAMELLEGQTLKERLRGGPLPMQDVVDLGLQLADALSAAHAKGIVHRDIKPANVFITTRGTGKLLDFGLAKFVLEPLAGAPDAPTVTGEWATGAGVALGTVGYMSPEQVRGEPLDARTDLFSLGVVLYEMATGEAPFQGATAGAVLGAILHLAPTAPARLNPGLPAELGRIVSKLLEKERALRYQSAADLGVDLRQLKHDRESGRSAAPGVAEPSHIPSLAVLPFANMSADQENEYFSDGLAEDIIVALTQVPGLRVMARTSAFAFRGKAQDVREVGARLNVEHILQGSVRKLGNRIRVTAQLVKASDGYHLWSQRFDREMTDVFAIQDEISQAIVDKLRVRLSAGRPLVKRRTENVEAYNLYLKARYHLFKSTPEGLAKSKEYYEQALAADPSYALAWHGLAGFYCLLGMFGQVPPKAANAQAEQAARRALELDDQLAEAHAMMGALRASEYDWKAAEREFSRALAIDPASGEVLRWYEHYYLGPMKRLDDEVEAYLRAVETDPLSPSLQAQLGYSYCLKREWDRAIGQCRTALELDPQGWAYMLLGSCCLHIGKHDDAIRAAETVAQGMGRSSFAVGNLGWVYGSTGRTADALKLLDELRARAQQGYVPSWSFAVIYQALGEMDNAVDWFEKAIDDHEPLMLQFNVHPNYDPMRSHPRYPALLRKMNLPQ